MVISGLMYANRKAGFEAMTDAGLVTYQDSGLLLDQASEAYGESIIAYNWSSERDLCARFWEGLAMRNLVLTNRLDELQHFPELQEGVHYEAFGSIDELVDKAKYYSANRDAAWKIASRGYAAFYASNHTYTQRIGLLLDAMGLPKAS
jgi:spore maturation protein CgeB